MNKTLFVLYSAFILLAAACKKEKEEIADPPSPALGYWQGSYNTTGVLGNTNYAMLLKSGGSARVYDLGNKTDTLQLVAAEKANAVWTISGNTIQTTYKSGVKTVNTIATLNAAYTLMTGTWSFDGVVKGNFTLNK